MNFRRLLVLQKRFLGNSVLLGDLRFRIQSIQHGSYYCTSGSSERSRQTDNPDLPKLDQQLLHHLERTSLVDFDSEEAVKRLTEAIKFADQLMEVNTDGVEPLFTVLEDQSLHLREDTTENCSRDKIIKNASITEEDYFVAPPGNIPLEPSQSKFLQNSANIQETNKT